MDLTTLVKSAVGDKTSEHVKEMLKGNIIELIDLISEQDDLPIDKSILTVITLIGKNTVRTEIDLLLPFFLNEGQKYIPHIKRREKDLTMFDVSSPLLPDFVKEHIDKIKSHSFKSELIDEIYDYIDVIAMGCVCVAVLDNLEIDKMVLEEFKIFFE